ncbi:MAG: response regulator receiver protein, partial [Eubacteriales bacterium]|nr:response regulator receiver protein [Eubacteriales bacterium]
MDSTLIVSHSEKNLDAIYGMLQEASISQMMTVHSCGDARRLLLERDFDLVIINAPLPDETGESLARHIAGSGDCQVILA